MNQEDEIKLTGADSESLTLALGRLVDEYALSIGNDETTRQVSRYLDSTSGVLAGAGIGLRFRGNTEIGLGTWTAKVRDRVENGRFVSVEVQEQGESKFIPPSLSAGVVKLVGSDPLAEVARFVTIRRALDVVSPSGARVEITLDAVTVEFPKRSDFFELEIENKTASSSFLLELGECALRAGLWYSTQNKLGRALGASESFEPSNREAASFLAACRGTAAELAAPWGDV